MNDYRPYADEREARQAFRDHLDDNNPPLELLGIDGYSHSRVAETVDPVSFQIAFNDWLDSVQSDLPDDDEEEDCPL